MPGQVAKMQPPTSRFASGMSLFLASKEAPIDALTRAMAALQTSRAAKSAGSNSSTSARKALNARKHLEHLTRLNAQHSWRKVRPRGTDPHAFVPRT